jgi:hypothetical protein
MDFNETLILVNLIANEYTIDSKKAILLISVNKDNTLTFRISEIDGIWIKTCDMKYLKGYKDKLGYSGDWKSFFMTVVNAINRNNDIIFTKKKESLIMTICHLLTDEFKLKGDILIEKFIPFKSEEFRKINFEFITDLFSSRKQVFKQTEITEKPGKSSATKINPKKQMKRKFQHDLINPNVKKRKGRGAKFTEKLEEDDEDKKENEDKVDKEDK